ncbi:MAG: DUF6580 family putative transport protein [Patescibacteria group bacterium]|jgi:hypothetical protein
MRFSFKTTLLLAFSLLVFGVVMRMVPHPANFTPLTAIALVSGMYFRGKWVALVPVLTMVVSDVFLGWHNIVLFTWGSFAAAVLIGVFLRRTEISTRIIGGALAGSTLFFLVTNWAVWQFTVMYTKDFSGLLLSYEMALPFFRTMLTGDLIYTAALVGVFELVFALQKKRVALTVSN